eukprot:TRINITY_DN12709_c0_g1_i2.p1 TRINITY_DN12709_c0_g1~~TRINITY_DN12709_c0_g1_i2.p1  ORF type:complete len:504 (+),score=103.70 TRINITY_DN12709_c0_g1_i2:63-1574(+)
MASAAKALSTEGSSASSSTARRSRAVSPNPKSTQAASSTKPGEPEKKADTGKAAEAPAKSDLTGEYGNICLLLVLYTLQGIPLGLGRVVPMILKDRGASYSELGTYSWQSWPFSLKLLWAPLVDVLYIKQIGRRKTWMVPCQLLIGAIMLYASTCLDSLLYGEKPAIIPLTLLFLSMNFLSATQDTAVDGWALTMLRKENAAYQATCNAVGQTFGFTLGLTGVTMLEQLKWMDLSGFMFYMGIFFILVTVCVALLKQEEPLSKEDEPEGLVEAYSVIFSMLKLKPIRTLIIVMFTWNLGFAVVDSVAPLKFQEYGVPKEYMTYMSSVIMPLEIVLPVFASRWTSGPMPFDLAMWMYPVKVATVPLSAALAYWTPSMDPFPWIFWIAMMAVALIGSVSTEWMFVSKIALFAKVSDPAFGGTYMSFLNTVSNLGAKYPPTATFFLVDYFTCRHESCLMQADGFYVMSAACFVVGVVWYILGAQPVDRMQKRDMTEWQISAAKKTA